jgi:heme/copper-type cytochrome/quinol oxidase subunit 1
MSVAKLFGTLAVLQLALALLQTKMRQSIDILFHATYFVFAGIHVQMFLAAASACFALIYFAASRWVKHPLNSSLGLTHFVMAIIGFALVSLYLYAVRAVPDHWPIFALLVGILSFLLGVASLAVNCAWTAITAFRSH